MNDDFWYFKMHYSPAYENRLYQADLTEEEYAAWAVAYLKGGYGVDSMSPFSANYSVLERQVYDEDSRASDPTTLYELEVLEKIADSMQYELRIPILVGPDRRSVEGTVNTLLSYEEDGDDQLRPNYRNFVQAIGTQARYPDLTATVANFEELADEISQQVWCTMCS